MKAGHFCFPGRLAHTFLFKVCARVGNAAWCCVLQLNLLKNSRPHVEWKRLISRGGGQIGRCRVNEIKYRNTSIKVGVPEYCGAGMSIERIEISPEIMMGKPMIRGRGLPWSWCGHLTSRKGELA
jgi:hypothetical protein